MHRTLLLEKVRVLTNQECIVYHYFSSEALEFERGVTFVDK